MISNLNQIRVFSAVTVLVLSGVAVNCGPMNGTPPPPASAQASACGGAIGGPSSDSQVLAFSKNRTFLVHSLVEDAKGGIAPVAVVGVNTYKIHLTHGEDLHSVGSDVQLTATYNHIPLKAGKTPNPATIKKISDNTFEVTVKFRPGTSVIDIHLTDGSDKDDYEIPVTI